ncbi:hypothetical protein H1R20_g7975, partial [Candolleomyces eurysporus]
MANPVPPFQPAVNPAPPFQPALNPTPPFQPAVNPVPPFQPANPAPPFQPMANPVPPFQPMVNPVPPFQCTVNAIPPFQPLLDQNRVTDKAQWQVNGFNMFGFDNSCEGSFGEMGDEPLPDDNLFEQCLPPGVPPPVYDKGQSDGSGIVGAGGFGASGPGLVGSEGQWTAPTPLQREYIGPADFSMGGETAGSVDRWKSLSGDVQNASAVVNTLGVVTAPDTGLSFGDGAFDGIDGSSLKPPANMNAQEAIVGGTELSGIRTTADTMSTGASEGMGWSTGRQNDVVVTGNRDESDKGSGRRKRKPEVNGVLMEGTGGGREKRARKGAREVEDWVLLANTSLRIGVDDAKWSRCVDLWLQFEKAALVKTSRLTELGLGPGELTKWMGARKWDADPVIADLRDFARRWLAWWLAMQPAERKAEGQDMLVPVTGEHCNKLVFLRKGGANGIVLLLVGLKWWAPLCMEDCRWYEVVEDLTVCLATFVA